MVKHPFKVGDKVRYTGTPDNEQMQALLGDAGNILRSRDVWTIRTTHGDDRYNRAPAITLEELSPVAFRAGGGPGDYYQFWDKIEEFFKIVPPVLASRKDIEELYG